MKRLLILLCCVSLAGCVPHFKDVDSYNTLFRNNEVTPPGSGDPYTFGGIATGSGGRFAKQSYATDNQAYDFRDDTESGKLGQISKDRTQTPGNLPGVTGTLPNTGSSAIGPASASAQLPASGGLAPGAAPSDAGAGGPAKKPSPSPSSPKTGG